MQFCPVKVADAFGGLLYGGHGDKAIATSAGTFGISHHLSSHDLQKIEKQNGGKIFNVRSKRIHYVHSWDGLVN